MTGKIGDGGAAKVKAATLSPLVTASLVVGVSLSITEPSRPANALSVPLSVPALFADTPKPAAPLGAPSGRTDKIADADIAQR